MEAGLLERQSCLLVHNYGSFYRTEKLRQITEKDFNLGRV